MDLGLKDKVIIVTAGASSIGENIVRVLSGEDAIAVIVGTNETDNRKLQSELEDLGGAAFSIVAEMNEPSASEQAVKAIIEKFGRIDGLVNNAGVNDNPGPGTGHDERFMESIYKNLLHDYLMTNFALPFLKISRGSIVNISSKPAETDQWNTSAHAVANGGRNALTREWAVELLKYGIRVNSVIVGESRTSRYGTWVRSLNNRDENSKEISSKITLENGTTRSVEIANTVAFLLSGKSSHTTGQLIHVDGRYG